MSAEMIERYMEWRQENEGRQMDVSPKAFALEEALSYLDAAYDPTGFTTADVADIGWKVVARYRELHADG